MKPPKRRKLLSIIIPVYNEQHYVEKVIQRVLNADTLNYNKQLIIVDDGSTDNTPVILASIAKKFKKRKASTTKITVVRKRKNEGKGTAIRKGIDFSKGNAVLIQDADLEYHPDDIAKLLRAFELEKHPVVYGSRMLGKKRIQHGGMHFYLGGKFINLLTNVLYDLNLTDEATGYKLFETKILKDARLTCTRFEFCPEVTAKIAKKKIPIHEVAIRYKGRTIQEGKKIRWKDGVEAIWTLLKYRFST